MDSAKANYTIIVEYAQGLLLVAPLLSR